MKFTIFRIDECNDERFVENINASSNDEAQSILNEKLEELYDRYPEANGFFVERDFASFTYHELLEYAQEEDCYGYY